MTMGTASSMACMVEALGMSLPGNAAIPAVDSRRKVLSQLSGRRIVEMVYEDLKPSKILTKKAFDNAIVTNGAVGGSTNVVLHLIAIARRLGIDLKLDDWNRLSNVPTIVNLQPSGEFLMEEFFYAGGLPVVLKALIERGLVSGDLMQVSGKTLWEGVKDAENFDDKVIRSVENPLSLNGGIAVLKGNLAPNGAVIKPSAATPSLMKHKGPAVVFDSIEDYHVGINDENLEIDRNSIMVLRNCGPVGYPGMAEVANMTLPAKLLKTGVTDMIRISDARMSGTAYGTVILHVSPEAAIGGPLALVQNGDMIQVDVESRTLHLDVPDAELEARKLKWKPTVEIAQSGYLNLFQRSVLQADEGCDFDFLVGKRGSTVKRDSH